jgi:hypothetical protein
VGFILSPLPGKSKHLLFVFLGAVAELRTATICVSMSVCLCVHPSVSPSAFSNCAPTGRIFKKFGIWVFLENLSRKFKFHYNLTRITDTPHADLCTFVIISRWILLRMRNVSDKIRENQNPQFMFTILIPKIVPFMR